MPNSFGTLEPVPLIMVTIDWMLPVPRQSIGNSVVPDLEKAFICAIGGRNKKITTVSKPKRKIYNDLMIIHRRKVHHLGYFLVRGFSGSVLHSARRWNTRAPA